MIDLHTHSLLSDGELLPSELSRRLEEKGYKFLAITDHADMSNLQEVVPQLVRACEGINRYSRIKVIPGIEITHPPLKLIKPLVEEARVLGAKLVIVHGETTVEPVHSGTNRMALLSGIDILAHPGLISEEDVRLAKKQGVYLEISGRKGHSLSNGYVANLARKYKAKLVLDSDSHEVGDLMSLDRRWKVGLGAGLSKAEIKEIDRRMLLLARRVLHGA